MIAKQNTPQLRFQEFDGDWEKKYLGEICDIVGGGTPDTNIPEYWNGDIQWFTPTEIKSDFVENSVRTITELGLQKSSAKKLPVGTILLTTRATIGEVSISLKECSTNQGFQSLIMKEGNSNFFIFNWIKENKYELTSRANGSTFPEISKSEIQKICLNIPKLPEQQKIASFLSAVDEKIQQLTRKASLLEQYKKGVMQQLFSGKLRFKDENGDDYPDWKSVKMNELFSFKQGIQCGVEDQFFEKKDNMERFIRIIDLTSDKEIPRFINNIDKENVLFEDDLFMVRYGVPGLIGFGYNGIIANNLFRLIPKKNVHNKFYLYVLTHLKKDIMNLSSSTTMPALNFSSLGVLKIPEIEIEEQQKIANFISSIDAKIESTNQQINQTQSFKKGLLQKMFV